MPENGGSVTVIVSMVTVGLVPEELPPVAGDEDTGVGVVPDCVEFDAVTGEPSEPDVPMVPLRGAPVLE